VNAAAGVAPLPGLVVGVGIDAVDIERFRRVLERRPTLADRLFSRRERAQAAAGGDPVPPLAARFAAKEAVVKALGTGLWSFPLRDVEVVGPAGGPPRIRLGRRAAESAARLGVTAWHLWLSAEPPVAMAVALAEGHAVPADSGSR